MARIFKSIPKPEFLLPSDVSNLETVTPSHKKHVDDGLRSTNVVKTDNFGLLMARYIPLQVIRNGKKDAISEINNKGNEVVYQTLRNLWFEYLPDNFTNNNKVIVDLIENTHMRWDSMTRAHSALRFSMYNLGRLIVGFGNKGPLEIGLTLHPVTGLPYIPGSALKGLCRSYLLQFVAARWNIEIETKSLKQLDEALIGDANAEVEILEPELAMLYRSMFGNQTDAGQCVFFDAVVKQISPEGSLLTVDVMTPHFSEYYKSQGSMEPHDAYDPTPILYITVTERTLFHFAIALRKNYQVEKQILIEARELLTMALQELGIGAKTAQGYGVFAPAKQK